MYSYLVSVAYDGSEFAGWACQPHKFTVQGYIETTLSKILQQKISILATSRTDKGVHALDQNFTLRLNLDFSEKKMLNLLKKALRKHLLVHQVKKVGFNFHPIKSVIRKEYRYFINTQEYNLFQRKYCWEYNLPLETKKLNQILEIFQGKHDFFNYAFCPYKDREKINTVREIFTFRSWKRKNIVIIKIIARHFLRYQIRALIGEVINCYETNLIKGLSRIGNNSLGRQTTADLQNKLANSDQLNYKYKNLAPAAGLYLWKIVY